MLANPATQPLVQPDRIEHLGPMHIVGCPQYANPLEECPSDCWNRLNSLRGPLRLKADLGFDVGLQVFPSRFSSGDRRVYYLAGVALTALPEQLPTGVFATSIPASNYAVFPVADLSKIGGVFRNIYDHWLPESGYKLAESYDFERYYGMDRIEILVPVKWAGRLKPLPPIAPIPDLD